MPLDLRIASARGHPWTAKRYTPTHARERSMLAWQWTRIGQASGSWATSMVLAMKASPVGSSVFSLPM